MNLNDFFIFFVVSLGPIEFEECNTAIATEGKSYCKVKDVQEIFEYIHFQFSKELNFLKTFF